MLNNHFILSIMPVGNTNPYKTSYFYFSSRENAKKYLERNYKTVVWEEKTINNLTAPERATCTFLLGYSVTADIFKLEGRYKLQDENTYTDGTELCRNGGDKSYIFMPIRIVSIGCLKTTYGLFELKLVGNKVYISGFVSLEERTALGNAFDSVVEAQDTLDKFFNVNSEYVKY